MARKSPDVLHPDKAFLLGYLTKPHGIRGEVRAHLQVQDLTPYLDLDLIYLPRPDGKLAAVSIERLRPDGDKEVILQLAGVESRNDAEELAGIEIYLPDGRLPKLKPGQFFYHQVIGYQVVDAEAGAIGEIEDILESAGNDLIQVRHSDGAEVLIPLVDDVVGAADHTARTLTVTLPPGLLDLYLSEPPPPDDADDAPLEGLLPPGAKAVW